MKIRNVLVWVLTLSAVITISGCGAKPNEISTEDYDAVVAERDALQAQLDSANENKEETATEPASNKADESSNEKDVDNKNESNDKKSSDEKQEPVEEFIYPAVYERKLDTSDLNAISDLTMTGLPSGKTTTQMIINEIYARHGYIFTNDEIKKYFESKSWYKGASNNDSEVTAQFSQIEKDNIIILKGDNANNSTNGADSKVLTESTIDWNDIEANTIYSAEQLAELKLETIRYISDNYGSDFTPIEEDCVYNEYGDVLYTITFKDSSGKKYIVDGNYDENTQPYFIHIDL